MFRQYDFECLQCHRVTDGLVSVPHGKKPPNKVLWKTLDLDVCPYCGGYDGAKRCKVNHIAKYLADRPFSPMVKGGSFDTEGYSKLPPLPQYDPEVMPFSELRRNKHYQAVMGERKARAKENKRKRARARAIRSGANVDIRHNPLPGDPKLMS